MILFVSSFLGYGGQYIHHNSFIFHFVAFESHKLWHLNGFIYKVICDWHIPDFSLFFLNSADITLPFSLANAVFVFFAQFILSG